MTNLTELTITNYLTITNELTPIVITQNGWDWEMVSAIGTVAVPIALGIWAWYSEKKKEEREQNRIERDKQEIQKSRELDILLKFLEREGAIFLFANRDMENETPKEILRLLDREISFILKIRTIMDSTTHYRRSWMLDPILDLLEYIVGFENDFSDSLINELEKISANYIESLTLLFLYNEEKARECVKIQETFCFDKEFIIKLNKEIEAIKR